MPPWRRRRKEATPHCYLGVANEAMKLRAAPGAQRVGKTFERGGVWVSHCRILREEYPPRVASKRQRNSLLTRV